jgi:nitrite reductase (NADH) large subunit
MQRLLVIGNGMVGHRFCERVVELGCHDRVRGHVLRRGARPAYDRVHLSEFFAGRGAEELALTSREWYGDHGLDLQLGRPIAGIDRERCEVVARGGERFRYDALVLACGSTPFVPAIPGVDLAGVFVYRTIDDLGAIRAWARDARRAAVIGGGLLGLEAAKAALDLGPRGARGRVCRPADAAAARPRGRSAAARRDRGARGEVHLGMATEAIAGEERVRALRFSDQPELPSTR